MLPCFRSEIVKPHQLAAALTAAGITVWKAVMRLGAVLSVIWLLGFAGFVLFGSVRELHERYDRYVEYCYAAILDKDPTQTERYEYCLSDANEFYQEESSNYKKQIPWFLIEDFGALAVGWALVLLGIVIVRSVKGGLSSVR